MRRGETEENDSGSASVASIAHQGAALRQLAHSGATRMPRWFLKCAPRLIGPLFALLVPSARRQVGTNLRRIHGPRDAVTEALDVVGTFAEFASCLAESLAARRADVEAHVEVRGGHRLEALLESGRGVVLVPAHAGPWDGAAIALRRLEREVLMVMHEESDDDASGLQDEIRRQSGVGVLRLGGQPLAALPVLQHLQTGGIAALQLDRPANGRSVVAGKLFGGGFPVPVGPFVLAGLAGVPVLPAFSARSGFFRRVIQVGDPLWPSRRPGERELASLVDAALAQMELHLRRYPRQWFHFVDRTEEQRLLEGIGTQGQRNPRGRRPASPGASHPHLAKAPA